jgi:pyruvate,orthophosphate dikinase
MITKSSSNASKRSVKERTGKSFPNDPWDQLKGAVGAYSARG